MSRLSIKGVIVPSVYDDDWLADDIEKGMFTPLSRVERALEEIDEKTNEPLELYINSPGGSVLAGHEMLNVIRQWQTRTEQPVNVTVGAMSASAASTISTMLGPVTAHENAMFMFHGAQSIQLGGSQAMDDMADLLNKINGMVISALVSRYGFDPEMVAEWFSEGRMGWLTAQEAKDSGLVKEIIPAAAPQIEFPAADIDRYQQSGLAVAAMLETGKQEDNMKLLQTIAEKLGMDKTDKADEKTVVDGLDAKLEELSNKAEAAYDEGKKVGVDEGKASAEAEAKPQIDDLTAKVEAAETAKTETEQERDDLQKKLDEAEQRIAQIDKGFGGDNDVPDTGAVAQFWAAVQELVESGHSKDAAMLKAQRENPKLHKAVIEQANR